MRINIENVKALNPCNDRFNNFVAHYPGFDGSLTEFLNLDNITYGDKVWVFVRLATHVQNVNWSILCAESVLQNFEAIYPDDKRPRQAIEAAQAFALNPCEENRLAAESAARSAAESAARSAAARSARSAARSAAESAAWSAAARSAAWSAAWSAARSAAWSAAARSAAWSAARSAAWSAAWSAARSAAEAQQEELNLQFMIMAVEASGGRV